MKETKTNIILPRYGLTTKNNHKSLKLNVGIALNKAISIINTYKLEINRRLYTQDGQSSEKGLLKRIKSIRLVNEVLLHGNYLQKLGVMDSLNLYKLNSKYGCKLE